MTTADQNQGSEPYTLARLSALVGSIYQGPDETPLWNTFLQELRQELEASICFLILRNPAQGDPGLLLSDGLPLSPSEHTHNIYSDGLYAIDPFVNLPQGEVVLLEELIPRESLHGSDFYQRCMKPFDIEHILGIDMQLATGMRVNLRVTRSPNAKPFTKHHKKKLEPLLPHLHRAIRLYVRLQALELERHLLDRAVSQLSLGTIILDDQRRVLQTNAVADSILSEQDGIQRRGDMLVFAQGLEAKSFRDLLTDAIDAHASRRPHAVKAMAVTRRQDRLPLNLVLRPLPTTERVEGQVHATVVVFISDPEYHSRTSVDILGQLYGLTPAEARVALALADGQSLEEVSKSLFISRNTARAHLRSIFSKTGVTQQTKLVSLVLKSVAAFLADHDVAKNS